MQVLQLLHIMLLQKLKLNYMEQSKWNIYYYSSKEEHFQAKAALPDTHFSRTTHCWYAFHEI